MPRLLVLLALAAGVAAVVPATTSATPATATAAASCHNLTVDAAVKTALTNAHARRRDGAIARGSVYYGRCGRTQYAIASFSKALADQPEKFRKLPGRGWKDMGDGFEDGCDAGARAPIPRALVTIWGTCQRMS